MKKKHTTYKFTMHVKPKPKLKMTGNQSWTPKARAYVEYKEFVKGQFLDSLIGTDFKSTADKTMMLTGKPIPKSKNYARLDVMFYFTSYVHCDPENGLGAIADALFNEDKYLSVHADYEHIGGNGPPQVDVIITLTNYEK